MSEQLLYCFTWLAVGTVGIGTVVYFAAICLAHRREQAENRADIEAHKAWKRAQEIIDEQR